VAWRKFRNAPVAWKNLATGPAQPLWRLAGRTEKIQVPNDKLYIFSDDPGVSGLKRPPVLGFHQSRHLTEWNTGRHFRRGAKVAAW
jgi:hypothetical protein